MKALLSEVVPTVTLSTRGDLRVGRVAEEAPWTSAFVVRVTEDVLALARTRWPRCELRYTERATPYIVTGDDEVLCIAPRATRWSEALLGLLARLSDLDAESGERRCV